MECKDCEIIVNGVTYVKKETSEEKGLQYVLVRTYSAGVHIGYLESRKGKEVVLRDSTRIWKWSGAATLSQLATTGTKDPNNCKFSVKVSENILTEAIEIIPLTLDSINNLEGVKRWKI